MLFEQQSRSRPIINATLIIAYYCFSNMGYSPGMASFTLKNSLESTGERRRAKFLQYRRILVMEKGVGSFRVCDKVPRVIISRLRNTGKIL